MDGFTVLYILMLAAVTGYEIASKTPTTVYLPLLSCATFIQGMMLVGAMLAMGQADTPLQTVIAFIAVALAAANVVGGYVLSSRIQSLFKMNKVSDLEGDQ